MNRQEYQKEYRQTHKEQFSDYQKKYYRKNVDRYKNYDRTQYEINYRDRRLIYHREYTQKVRNKFFDMYGHACSCCGESMHEFLTIEHKNGQAGKKRDSSYRAYLNAIKEYRPDLYETLCMNCNHAKGRFGFCPHQKGHMK